MGCPEGEAFSPQQVVSKRTRDEQEWQVKHCLRKSGTFHHVMEVLSPGGKNFLSATRQ